MLRVVKYSIIFLGVLCLALGLYFLIKPGPLPDLHVCPLDALQCPDGTYVGRTGPDCMFVCPEATTTKQTSDRSFLLQRFAAWAPCALPEQETCGDELSLTHDGTLRMRQMDGRVLTEHLSMEALEKIVSRVRASHILQKNCDAMPVSGYIAAYRITLDTISKDITFPGCAIELRAIEQAINEA